MKRRAYLVMQQHSTYNKRIGETLHCAGKDIYARAEIFFRQNVVVRVGLTRTTKFQAWLVAGLDSSF